jgi:hypothetical protein
MQTSAAGRKIARDKIYEALAEQDALFDYSVYPKFYSLISLRDNIAPKLRPLSWLMRLIEEIYDNRYARDTAELREDAEGAAQAAGAPPQSSRPKGPTDYPSFVVEFFSKRYGLPQLIDQTCWDLLYNVHAARKEYLEVEVFARFLEEYYDPDDLLFFLYVRSVVQKELRFTFRSRWTELGKSTLGADKTPKAIFMSHRECVLVARVVFGSETDPLFRTFMALVESRLQSGPSTTSTRSGRATGGDSRRIEVMQFLHLALTEYHDTRPSDELESRGFGGQPGIGQSRTGSSGNALTSAQQGMSGSPTGSSAPRGGNAMGATSAAQSKQDQDRLFREAERDYEERQRRLALTGEMGGDAGMFDDGASARSGGGEGSAASSPGRGSLPSVSKQLLDILGTCMHGNNEAYLDTLLKPAVSTLPEEMVSQLRSDMCVQLEQHVDNILERVISIAQGDSAVASGSDAGVRSLAAQFTAVVSKGSAAGGDEGSPVDDFCKGVLALPQLKQEMEPLSTLLVTYAQARLQEAAAQGGNDQ